MRKKLVVVTGASSGIGRTTAIRLAEKGYPLLLCARRLDRLTELNLPNTLCEQVDITKEGEFEQALVKAQKEFGPADCLVNNAGVMLLGTIDTQDESEWKKMYDVNVLSLLNTTKSVLSTMKEQGAGTIINISSIAGRKTFLNHAAYCGTKFAVHSLSETMREELSSFGVRVTVIAPGAVETELLSHTTSDTIKDNYNSWKEAMGGALDSEEVAQAILYAYERPQNVCIREIVLAATKQSL